MIFFDEDGKAVRDKVNGGYFATDRMIDEGVELMFHGEQIIIMVEKIQGNKVRFLIKANKAIDIKRIFRNVEDAQCQKREDPQKSPQRFKPRS